MSIIIYKQRFMPPTDRFTPPKNYLHIGYIATRPRSIKNPDGVHGLFGYLPPSEHGSASIRCDEMPWQETAKYIRQLSRKNINIFRSIISFDRMDADELGLVTQKDWREYAEQHVRILAEKNNIDIANFGWCGAYHNEDEHPHLHIVFWNKAQMITKNYVPPKVADDIRIALIKSTFEDKIRGFYEQKKLSKQNINKYYDEAIRDFDSYMKDMRSRNFKAVKSEFDIYSKNKKINISQLFNSDKQLADAAEKLFMLRKLIPKGGRIAYKLLPPEVKGEIDDFTDELIRNNTYLQTAVEQYIDSLCNLKRLYSSLKDPEKLKNYRDKCRKDAESQISAKVIKSMKAIVSKEYDVKNNEYTTAQKQYLAIELMHEVLDFFACSVVANHSKQYEKNGRIFGDVSEREMKEWYLKNKDKGMEL